METLTKQTTPHARPAWPFFRFLIALLSGLGLSVHPLGAQEEGDKPHSVTELLQVDPAELSRDNQNPVTSYSRAIQPVTESVVSVFTARIVQVSPRGSDPREEMMRRFFGLPLPRQQPRDGDDEVEERRIPAGVGSGVIATSNGYILTNHHVVSDRNGDYTDEILVRLPNGEELVAEVVGSDPRTDVAVLKVEAEDLPAVTMADSDRIEVGDIAFAIGNPMGVGQTVTMGIISATGRSNLQILGDQAFENFIQTDASINPGNSGGALVDAQGRLIGVNTAILSRTGGNIGIGFAIPTNLVRSVMVSLIETGEVQRGFLGVAVGDVDQDIAEAFELESTEGALIQSVEEGLPAAQAGLERGDVIVEVAGRSIRSSSDLRLWISQLRPGQTVEVKVVRDGEPRSFEVTLGNLDDPFGTGVASASEIVPGVEGSALNDNLRATYRVPDEVNGVVVTEVAVNSPYIRVLQEGMVIVEVNDQPVTSRIGVQRELQRGVNKLWVWSRGTFGYLALRVR